MLRRRIEGDREVFDRRGICRDVSGVERVYLFIFAENVQR